MKGFDEISKHEIALTHVESLADDLVKLAAWLGCKPPPTNLPHVHGVYPSMNDKYLSDKGR